MSTGPHNLRSVSAQWVATIHSVQVLLLCHLEALKCRTEKGVHCRSQGPHRPFVISATGLAAADGHEQDGCICGQGTSTRLHQGQGQYPHKKEELDQTNAAVPSLLSGSTQMAVILMILR
jgi:hypothetical protein